MWKDPIVEKIHRYREARAKKFNYDVQAMYADIKAKEKQYELAGWKVVSFCASDSNTEALNKEASKTDKTE